jgi:hypothetical protein
MAKQKIARYVLLARAFATDASRSLIGDSLREQISVSRIAAD